MGDPGPGAVVTPRADARVYKAFTLDNGVRAVVIQDRDAAFAAACANVQCGYFDDPPALPGLAHFLEHAVHLGSRRFPDEREYKQFLAQHGGGSNASTNMVHTQYHLKVAAAHLPGALARMGAMLSAPLLEAEPAGREVENVHAEYSRNTNSDARKILQLRRSLGRAPLSKFSTGSIATLRDAPAEAGVDVAAALRALWGRAYIGPAATVAVLGPQAPEALEAAVREAFADMPAAPHDGGDGGGGGGGGVWEAGSGAAEPGSGDGDGGGGNGGGGGGPPSRYGALAVYGEEQRGALVRVAPMRELRTLEVQWFVPYGVLSEPSKPWRVAGHVLGHESYGSAAHLLKRQGLIQSLSAGMGEEVRLGRGFFFWRLELQLTEAGEGAVPHVLGTLARAVRLLRTASTEQLRAAHSEAAELASLRFDWRDASEPLAAVKDAAFNLHYYPAPRILSGPALLGDFDEAALRRLLAVLEPAGAQVLWASRRWAGLTSSKERWYGASYSLGPLEAEMSEAIQSYPGADAAVPRGGGGRAASEAGCSGGGGGGGGDEEMADAAAAVAGADARSPAGAAAGAGAAAAGLAAAPRSISDPGATTGQGQQQLKGRGQAGQEQQQQQSAPGPWPPAAGELHLPAPGWGLPRDLSLRAPRAEGARDWRAAPEVVWEEAGLCCWHALDTGFGLPKAHVRLHLVTPSAYETPAAAVATRLLLRIAEDVLLPEAYVADLAGSAAALEALQTGVRVALCGYPDVLPQLLRRALDAIAGVTEQQVAERFATMAGRMRQALVNWHNNNPGQHAEYAAEHALQARHHHTDALLSALSAATPADVLRAARRLGTGDCHCDMLCYGNLSSDEARALASDARRALGAPRGLHGCVWSAVRGRAVDLSPCVWPPASPAWLGAPLAAAREAAAAGAAFPGAAAAWVGGGRALEGGRRGVAVTYLPENPNPANKNHALYYYLQVGPDDPSQQALLDAFVQASSRRCFHALRTQQRLGYSVSLHANTVCRVLGLAVRVQSPEAPPALLAARVSEWLAAFRGELEGLADEEVENHKRALCERYLEPPKSLRDAALRAWRPIERRTLDWARRQAKADAAARITKADLTAFFDRHLSPASPGYRLLCTQIWGGGAPAAGAAGGAAEEAAAAAVAAAEGAPPVSFAFEVAGSQLAAFKASQPLWLAPAVARPATAVVAVAAVSSPAAAL
ncbi:insulin-degrading-like metalloprotease [Raphidocelis subcapitata]|uniref:Insulin-degrading-like metalloprotease n=1 Tax=Raphidocelis subcapitata TaxID=307507 RepID=A0A2V0PC86_9CHLO|nr:insulin-degrading-like metalloprotease [Raphidocelis subcapitata]|eukprot:GBF97149.1 insulin-degrading-like metalloprotease [Raphidocelis subcapitata]